VLLVNLETFETMEGVDEYRLMELGLPEGFENAEEVSVEQWIEAGQKFAAAQEDSD